MTEIGTVFVFCCFAFAGGFWFFMGAHFAAKMMKVRVVVAHKEDAE